MNNIVQRILLVYEYEIKTLSYKVVHINITKNKLQYANYDLPLCPLSQSLVHDFAFAFACKLELRSFSIIQPQMLKVDCEAIVILNMLKTSCVIGESFGYLFLFSFQQVSAFCLSSFWIVRFICGQEFAFQF